MAHFLDSSALVKRYVTEKGSPWVLAITDPRAHNVLSVASIAQVEAVSAIRRRQHGGSVSAADAAAFVRDCQDDFAHQYQVVELTPALVARAVMMADRHALRGGDALQLAAALEVQAEAGQLGVPLVLVSADGELNDAAKLEGMAVENPEDHP